VELCGSVRRYRLSGTQKKGWQVSTSTALQAYFWLENRELIEARTRSSSYVRVPFSDLAPEPGFEPPRSVPRDAGLDARLGQLLQLRAASGALQLGAAVPSPDFYPVRKLNQAIRRIIRENPAHSRGYEFPPGNAELRLQIAKHASRQIGRSSWEEIIVTVGAMEGLTLCLRAVAQAGDVIAVESPTFLGILQLIQSPGQSHNAKHEALLPPRIGQQMCDGVHEARGDSGRQLHLPDQRARALYQNPKLVGARSSRCGSVRAPSLRPHCRSSGNRTVPAPLSKPLGSRCQIDV
jgi:hypothetical protein